MANSLTDWLAAKVSSCVQAPDHHFKTLRDKQSLLEDIAFARGAKVQIRRFFAPRYLQEAQSELQDLIEKEGNAQQVTFENVSDDGCLWAEVADKVNYVHVRFSGPCVARFNSRYARELISLRGTIISLKSFRPSISLLPSLLENRQRIDGPFAPLQSVRPALFLEIESFEVVGAINEVIFWQANELQTALLNKEGDASLFKQWFKAVRRLTIKEQQTKAKKTKVKVEADADAEADDMNLDPSSSHSQLSAISSAAFITESMPPPFQRAVPPPKQDSQEEKTNSQASSTIKKEKSPWGDFTLSQDDEFGLDAAASQLIERHEQGIEEEGEEEEPRIVNSFDSMFPAPTLELTTERRKSALEEQDDRDALRTKSIESMQEIPSQVETLPATYPTSLIAREESSPNDASGISQKETTSIRPPSVTDNTSFPFSLLINEESLGPEAKSENEKRPTKRLNEDNDEEDVDLAFKPSHPYTKRVGKRSRREFSTQTEDAGEARCQSAPIQGSRQHAAMTDLPQRRERGITTAPFDSSEANKWNNNIRKLTLEEIKERDRTYSSRVDLIVD